MFENPLKVITDCHSKKRESSFFNHPNWYGILIIWPYHRINVLDWAQDFGSTKPLKSRSVLPSKCMLSWSKKVGRCRVRCTSRWLNTQNMTGTQHLVTKGCATGVLRPELSSWTHSIYCNRSQGIKDYFNQEYLTPRCEIISIKFNRSLEASNYFYQELLALWEEWQSFL